MCQAGAPPISPGATGALQSVLGALPSVQGSSSGTGGQSSPGQAYTPNPVGGNPVMGGSSAGGGLPSMGAPGFDSGPQQGAPNPGMPNPAMANPFMRNYVASAQPASGSSMGTPDPQQQEQLQQAQRALSTGGPDPRMMLPALRTAPFSTGGPMPMQTTRMPMPVSYQHGFPVSTGGPDPIAAARYPGIAPVTTGGPDPFAATRPGVNAVASALMRKNKPYG